MAKVGVGRGCGSGCVARWWWLGVEGTHSSPVPVQIACVKQRATQQLHPCCCCRSAGVQQLVRYCSKLASRGVAEL
jgi:hypothetical protein